MTAPNRVKVPNADELADLYEQGFCSAHPHLQSNMPNHNAAAHRMGLLYIAQAIAATSAQTAMPDPSFQWDGFMEPPVAVETNAGPADDGRSAGATSGTSNPDPAPNAAPEGERNAGGQEGTSPGSIPEFRNAGLGDGPPVPAAPSQPETRGETPETDKMLALVQEHADDLDVRKMVPVQHAIDLERRLHEALADAESWSNQADDRVTDAVQFLAERDAALAELRKALAENTEHARVQVQATKLIRELDAKCAKSEEDLRKVTGEREEARKWLGTLYDIYENGEPCYETLDPPEGYLGNAVKLTEEQDDAILACLSGDAARREEK